MQQMDKQHLWTVMTVAQSLQPTQCICSWAVIKPFVSSKADKVLLMLCEPEVTAGSARPATAGTPCLFCITALPCRTKPRAFLYVSPACCGYSFSMVLRWRRAFRA
jgi:hypothetical protein